MADVEELLDGVPVRLASAQAVRAQGERRRARRRVGMVTGALVAATAVGIGSWTYLAPPGPRGADAASEGGNPFKVDGTVQNLKPSDLPMHEVLGWKAGENASNGESSTAPLPQAGLDGVCNGWSGDLQKPQQQLTSAFAGKGDAKARYRVSQYTNTDLALEAIRGLGQTLRDCGLKEQKDGAYTGTPNGSDVWLEVSVRQWKGWVGVVEAQFIPTS
ncbi:hypothetical protein GL263_26670 [Streptomyces durbertensis]|uniref:Uncharacterized protein n=1 Tax=Streptomyces durbertensis TaxID=2448886 RepID=A0ABR6EPD1_9ACTN|nr:hypothetical protein [Streptomyces durbertensis]MBB1247103.1 hypothetical protein [Streptomyces durbertensis]